jgi:MFS family permease
MVAYAIGQGIAPPTAAAALGAVSLVSLAGRLATGWLCDRVGRPQTLTLAYTIAVLGIGALALLAVAGSPVWLVVYVALYGMAQGSSGIVASARAADVFAGASFGPGEALGAWLGGWFFDAWGSYLPAFGFAVAALAAGLVALWRVRADHPGRAGST